MSAPVLNRTRTRFHPVRLERARCQPNPAAPNCSLSKEERAPLDSEAPRAARNLCKCSYINFSATMRFRDGVVLGRPPNLNPLRPDSVRRVSAPAPNRTRTRLRQVRLERARYQPNPAAPNFSLSQEERALLDSDAPRAARNLCKCSYMNFSATMRFVDSVVLGQVGDSRARAPRASVRREKKTRPRAPAAITPRLHAGWPLPACASPQPPAHCPHKTGA